MRPPARSDRPTEATSFVSIRYEPIAQIGAGGMGSVTLARATTGPAAGRLVAIKRLYPHLEREAHFLDAFLDEVWLISSLHHPNVVEPLDWGRDAQGSYLVMEFVPGDSLRALIVAREAAGEPIPIEAVAEVVAAAAEGLHAAHELRNEAGEPLGLVHRDVSPANILVGFDGSVKIIDFGVAKAAGKLVQTASGMIKGKFGYMSPEQIRGQHIDRRSDVFSLGVVAWEALTLCRLYAGANEFEVSQMICKEEPVAPSELRAGVPLDLDRIVLRCLAKDPAARYATCAELARDVRAAAGAPGARAALARIAHTSLRERREWIERVVSAHSSVVMGTPSADPADATQPVDAVDATVSLATAAGFDALPTVYTGPPRAEPQRTHCNASSTDLTVSELPATAPQRPRVNPWSKTPPGTSAQETMSAPLDRRTKAVLISAIALVALVAMALGAWLGSR